MVGIEGRYILIKRVRGKEDNVTFQVDPSMDLALQVWISEASNLFQQPFFLVRLLCYSVLVDSFFITWACYAVAFTVKRNVALLILIVVLGWWLKKTGGLEPNWVAVWNDLNKRGLFYDLDLDFCLCSSGIYHSLQKYTKFLFHRLMIIKLCSKIELEYTWCLWKWIWPFCAWKFIEFYKIGKVLERRNDIADIVFVT